MATPSPALIEARRLVAAGFSVLPIATDGTKGPAWDRLPTEWDETEQKHKHVWGPFKTRRPTPEEVEKMFAGVVGIGTIGGAVSGNLETLDVDAPGLDEKFEAYCADQGPELLALIMRLVKVRTPREGGGAHYRYRTQEATGGNRILARDPDGHILIETRGEGGYAVAPGSPPSCHENNKRYELLRGDLANLPVLTDTERWALMCIAREFDLFVNPQPENSSASPPRERTPHNPQDRLLPGHDYNERGDVLPILIKHGWQETHRSAGEVYLRRHGKDRGHSATLRNGVFVVFTTSVPQFERWEEKKKRTGHSGYAPFAVYTILEHGGDYKAAAKALYREGYGEIKKTEFLPNRQISETEEPPDTSAIPSPGTQSDETPEQLEKRLRYLVAWKARVDDEYKWEVGRMWALMPTGRKGQIGKDIFGDSLSTVNHWATTWLQWREKEQRGPLRFAHCQALNSQPPEVRENYKARIASEIRLRADNRNVPVTTAKQIRNEVGEKKDKRGWQLLMEQMPKSLVDEIEAAMGMVEREGDKDYNRVWNVLRIGLKHLRAQQPKKTETQTPTPQATDLGLFAQARAHVANYDPDAERNERGGFIDVPVPVKPTEAAPETEQHFATEPETPAPQSSASDAIIPFVYTYVDRSGGDDPSTSFWHPCRVIKVTAKQIVVNGYHPADRGLVLSRTKLESDGEVTHGSRCFEKRFRLQPPDGEIVGKEGADAENARIWAKRRAYEESPAGMAAATASRARREAYRAGAGPEECSRIFEQTKATELASLLQEAAPPEPEPEPSHLEPVTVCVVCGEKTPIYPKVSRDIGYGQQTHCFGCWHNAGVAVGAAL